MRGRINFIWLAFLVSIVVLAALVAALIWPAHRQRSTAGIVVYCAAGLKQPVSAAARDYEKACGVRIQLAFAGSNTLLAQAKASRSGDLYLPADESYITLARQQDLIDEVLPLATQRPVLAVRADNPKAIRGLADLLKPGVKISQANPDAAAIGQVVRAALSREKQWDAIQSHRTVMKETVNEVAADIAVGSVDAGFVWDSNVRQMPGHLKAVEVPQFKTVRSVISIAVLKSSRQPAQALRFARFLAAPDKGLVRFKENGYEPVDAADGNETSRLQSHHAPGRVLAGSIQLATIPRSAMGEAASPAHRSLRAPDRESLR